MKRAIMFVVLAALVLPVSLGAAEDELTGCEPRFEEIQNTRILPHAFHDQSVESLDALYPEHEILAARRYSTLGAMRYSLLVYKETPLADSVHIAGVTVLKDRAWRFSATCTVDTLAEGLVSTLESIADLLKAEPPDEGA